MKRKKIFAAVVVFLLTLCVSVSAGASAYCWQKTEDGEYRCYRNGKLVVNEWVGKRHLNAEGYLDRNKWVSRTANGVTKTYFVRNDGKAVINFKAGWQQIGKKYYYYTSNGVLVKSKWIRIPNVGIYYVNKNGVRASGLVRIAEGNTKGYYYFTADGKSLSGKQKINGKYYYFDPTTRRAYANGFYRLGKKTYSFAANGVLQTGWVQRDGNWYYFKKYMGTSRWLRIGSDTYYLTSSGARAIDLTEIGGKLYYFDRSTGILQRNKFVMSWDGKRYSADADGVCVRVSHLGVPLEVVNPPCASAEAFIAKIAPLCQADWKLHRVLPSLSIAQACLESGFGTSDLYIYGFASFGIKATNWSGEFFRKYSPEYIDGEYVYIESDFRIYKSLAQSVKDHGALLQYARYQKVVGETDFVKAATEIRAAGYATDPEYTNKLINLYNRYNLGQYDSEALGR